MSSSQSSGTGSLETALDEGRGMLAGDAVREVPGLTPNETGGAREPAVTPTKEEVGLGAATVDAATACFATTDVHPR